MVRVVVARHTFCHLVQGPKMPLPFRGYSGDGLPLLFSPLMAIGRPTISKQYDLLAAEFRKNPNPGPDNVADRLF